MNINLLTMAVTKTVALEGRDPVKSKSVIIIIVTIIIIIIIIP